MTERLNDPLLASAEIGLPCPAWHQQFKWNVWQNACSRRHEALRTHTHHAHAACSGGIYNCWRDCVLLHMSPLAVIHFNKALDADIMPMKVETLGWRSWTRMRDQTRVAGDQKPKHTETSETHCHKAFCGSVFKVPDGPLNKASSVTFTIWIRHN